MCEHIPHACLHAHTPLSVPLLSPLVLPSLPLSCLSRGCTSASSISVVDETACKCKRIGVHDCSMLSVVYARPGSRTGLRLIVVRLCRYLV